MAHPLKVLSTFQCFSKENFAAVAALSIHPTHTLSLVWSLLLHIFGHFCEASRNPKPAEVGAGLAQDVVKETRGLTAIREPQPGFKHKTQYFLRGWEAQAWGQWPFMCSQTCCVCLGLQRPMSFIQQGQKIDKDEIKYHDIFWTFLVKQKIKQAQFYCQNVNLCTALGKADSGTHTEGQV